MVIVIESTWLWDFVCLFTFYTMYLMTNWINAFFVYV